MKYRITVDDELIEIIDIPRTIRPGSIEWKYMRLAIAKEYGVPAHYFKIRPMIYGVKK